MKTPEHIRAWIKANHNKHLCECGCGHYVTPTINRFYAGKSMRFINGHQNRGKERHEIHSARYIYVYDPSHPRADPRGYVKRATLVAERKIGRHLLPDEVVHHIDHNKFNDDPTNLMILTNAEHAKLHRSNHNPRGRPDINDETIASLRATGLSLRTIATALQTGTSTIRARLRKLAEK